MEIYENFRQKIEAGAIFWTIIIIIKCIYDIFDTIIAPKVCSIHGEVAQW